MPKVSVIVPSYNHAAYLKQRLESIYTQTYEDFEVLLLDDASTDHSLEILRSYEHKPFTTLVANERNSGSVFYQWQKGLQLAQGEYIWLAESDDFASPFFLNRLVQLLDDNPNVGLAYCQSWLINTDGMILNNAACWTADLDAYRWNHGFISLGLNEISQFLIYKNTIPNASAVLTRRSVWESQDIPNPPLQLCGDWLQWIKILSRSDIAFTSECLNFWRQNTSNARVASAGTLEWIEGEQVLKYAGNLLGWSEEEINQVLLKFLRRCWQWQKGYIETADNEQASVLIERHEQESSDYQASERPKMPITTLDIIEESKPDSSRWIIRNSGYCPICEQQVIFASEQEWLRDHYRCSHCNSIPRERALIYALNKFYPNWPQLHIHESSPLSRGASLKLKDQCENYIGTHFFPNFPIGEMHPSGWRNEDLEHQTFADESFDLIITQDVVEHLFNPAQAFSEIARTLKPGGAHIFTVPIVNATQPSRKRAEKQLNGDVNYLDTPQYHGNPINQAGSLVTIDWGYDICDFILNSSGLHTTIFEVDNIASGIRGRYIDVLISRKNSKHSVGVFGSMSWQSAMGNSSILTDLT